MRVEPGLSLAKADMKAMYLWAIGEVCMSCRALAGLVLPDSCLPLECCPQVSLLWSISKGRQTVLEELALRDCQLHGPQLRSHLVSKRGEGGGSNVGLRGTLRWSQM